MDPQIRNELINQYVKWGWSILPVKYGEKRPAVPSWTEYQKRHPTKEELREWFKDPNTGVGVVTGKISNILVVDEDSYKENGIKLDLQTPLAVVSGGGGRHLYFKYTEGIGNAVNHSKAIDIRGEGGFVVLPPTKHPNGQYYVWDNIPPKDLGELPALDSSLAEELARGNKSSEKLALSDYLSVSEGGRNDSLHRVACSILNKYPEKEAITIIMGINKTYSPPLTDWEVEQVVNSAKAFIARSPKKTAGEMQQMRDENEKPKMEILTFEEAENQYKYLMEKYGDGITTGFITLDDYFKFLPTHLYMVSAATHIGKTTFILNMAGRIARAGHKVIVASLEQNVFVVPRLINMFKSREGMENISFIAPDDMPTPKDFLELLEKTKEEKRVLIVDHLHYFARGTKGATESMDELVANMQMIAKKLEIPIVIVAHLRKLNKDNKPTLDDLKDSSSLSQIPAVVCLLHRDFTKEEELKAGSGYFNPRGSLFIAKNRVQGKTGYEEFTLADNGEIVFDKNPYDVINKKAEMSPQKGGFMQDFFND